MRYNNREVRRKEALAMHQHIIKGRNCLNAANLTALMEALSMQRPLLVSGGRMQAVFAARTGLELPCFGGYHPNPDLEDCIAGAEMYRAQGCDGLISIGGGSAMDTAKAVKAILLAQDMDAVKASNLPERMPLPHIAIPGTAGTGAEATPIAVVYVENEKLSLDHPALLPEGILLDGSLLDTLPLYHKKACAMDALCQGIESWWAVKATAESRVHAERAIRGVVQNMTAYLAGDAAAADAVLMAAYESGCAIRISRTTAAHAMSYQITKKLGYAHGHACMLTLPHLWRHLGEVPGLNAILGTEDGVNLLQGMLAELDMLSDALPDDDTLDTLAASVNTQRLGNHPEPLTTAELRAIYAQALTPVSEAEREGLASKWRHYAG